MSIILPKPSSLPEMPQYSDVPQEQQEEKLPSTEEIILNHEHRIQLLEAALMRIRGAI
jgi:hypothetical protein